jgi:hypothetical protein
MFFGIGAFAMFVAQDYRFGTSLKMGPGYFPTLLGGVLVAFGIVIMIKGLRSNEKIRGRMSVNSWRALIVLPAAIILFSLLVDNAGLVPALMVLSFVTAAAGSAFKCFEVLLLSLGLTAVSVALFVWGLGLPYRLVVGF